MKNETRMMKMVKEGKKYLMTRSNKRTGEIQEAEVKINWIEDRGDFWYVGYTPEFKVGIGRWGCAKIKKHGEYEAIKTKFVKIG